LSTDTRLRSFFPIAICACSFLALGCVEPLGPGFFFLNRQTEIRPATGASSGAQLHLRVVDRFNNAGNRPLESLEVRMPEGPTFGSRNLRVTIDGRAVSPQSASDAGRRFMRAPFDPVWNRHEPREIVTEWDFQPEPEGRGTLGASSQAFYVADETALPLWQAPSGIFVRGGPTPIRATLTVIAPPDFRVLAPGKQLKPGKDGNLTAHRFQIRPNEDFFPYVFAGRYLEQNIRTAQGEVVFWTFQPLQAQQAQAAAARLAASRKAYADFFGPATKNDAAIRIVEAPVDLPAEFGETDAAGGESFPNGVLLDQRAFTQGLADESILELAEYELARTWFGWRARPTPEAQLLMGRGLGLFGLVVAAERRSAAERTSMVAQLLERYNQSRRIAADKQLLEPAAEYSRAERVSTGYRAALFFVELEDVCGRENLSAAFQDIVRSRGGETVASEELRAATEAVSGRDLAEMFRAWLDHPGLPDDFRARYGNSPAAPKEN
jgi:hypothetical protein